MIGKGGKLGGARKVKVREAQLQNVTGRLFLHSDMFKLLYLKPKSRYD